MATRIILDDSDKIGLVVIRASDRDKNGQPGGYRAGSEDE
jgi:hypothetical protein